MAISTNPTVMRGAPAIRDGITRLLNERQAADLLNIKVPTLRRWRWAGKGPHFLKLGGAVRYEPSELEGFIAAARRSSTGDPGTGLPDRDAAI